MRTRQFHFSASAASRRSAHAVCAALVVSTVAGTCFDAQATGQPPETGYACFVIALRGHGTPYFPHEVVAWEIGRKQCVVGDALRLATGFAEPAGALAARFCDMTRPILVLDAEVICTLGSTAGRALRTE
jgi:hypothetical protein